jgi:hypothetical protein
VHQALAPERYEVRLGGAPVSERCGPLRLAADVEDLLAAKDRGAVEDADDDGRYLVGDHAGHDLVEQPHALRDLVPLDQRLPSTEPGDR